MEATRAIVFLTLTFLTPALLISGIPGCSPGSTQARNPAPIDRPEIGSTVQKVLLGMSLQQRPIEMEIFGDSPRTILIMGGIHGDERTSVYVSERLAEVLHRNPDITANITVAVLPVANPDGYAADTRTNSRGVDVNRNFPAHNWRRFQTARSSGGEKPLSEPEAVAVMKAIDMLSPRLIISIHSIGGGRECNNYDGPAEDIAKLMSQYNGYPPTDSIGYPTPGSLGTYAGIDRQIPIVTLELPRAQPGPDAWKNNREALLAAIEAVAKKPR